MQKTGKTLLIITGAIVAIMMLCFVTLGILVWVSAKNMFDPALEAKSEILVQLCENSDSLTQSDYEKYFSSDFKLDNTISETQEILTDEMFPSGFDCDSLDTQNLIEMLQSGQSIYVSTNLEYDITYSSIEFSYPTDKGSVKVILTSTNDKPYEINYVSY
ncbi:hypothetical protein JW887_05500 [Candidatus Dojkabacteria bacterium]|nr:hypothetical protein [Candidatus Dojkabacteria bacterium]